MKKWILIFVFCISTLPVNSQIITGGIEYTSKVAQQEMLHTTPKTVNQNLVNSNLFDTSRHENFTNMLKGNVNLKDRTLASFSDGTYGIIYKNNPTNVWYYTHSGNLMHVETKTSLIYPYKTYKYTPDGILVNMSLRISDRESYIFDKQGNLIAHWLGQNCYNTDGRIIMTRKIR